VFKDLDERYRAAFSSCLRLVKKLYDAGITIVSGTDTLPGYTLHRELELYTEAGLPAAKVLQLATIGAARVMRKEGELGSLEPGKLADMVMVEGDPAQNISAIRKVNLVIKDGTIFDIRSLQGELGVEP
jgi:imidazolonepropionase-like amidohydrolase